MTKSLREVYRPRFSEEIDWRIVGMTAVASLLAELDWIDGLTDGGWLDVVRGFAEAELFGLLILVFAAVLFRWRAHALSRPIALSLAVVFGCFAAQAITVAPYVGMFGDDFPGGKPSYWTLVWFFTRKSIML